MEPKSKFIKVRCNKCKNEQVIFGKCSTQVNCLVCNEVLAEHQKSRRKTEKLVDKFKYDGRLAKKAWEYK